MVASSIVGRGTSENKASAQGSVGTITKQDPGARGMKFDSPHPFTGCDHRQEEKPRGSGSETSQMQDDIRYARPRPALSWVLKLGPTTRSPNNELQALHRIVMNHGSSGAPTQIARAKSCKTRRER